LPYLPIAERAVLPELTSDGTFDVAPIAVVTGSNTRVHKFLEDGTAILGDQVNAAVEVSGTLKLELGGTEGNLKYLKSDATGVATWDQVDAVDVAVTPAGTLGSTDVQNALEELQGDIDLLSAGSGSSGLSFGTALGNAELQVSGAILLWQGTTNEIDVEVITLLDNASGGGIEGTSEEEQIIEPLNIKKLYNKSVKNLSGGELHCDQVKKHMVLYRAGI